MKTLVKKRSKQRAKAVKAKTKAPPVPRAAKAAPKKARPLALPAAFSSPPSNAVADKQQESYEEAIRLFYAQKYERADALFQKVLQGPNRTLAHHAQVHSNICAGRRRQPEVRLRTVEEHYNYAVTMINARRLDEATRHLETAVRMAPQAEHIHYALAAAQALQGNHEGAYQRLKAAIELEPGNRIRARTDADFAGVLGYPPVASLLHMGR